MARCLDETLTAAARAAVEANDWERDREAWNLPRTQSDTIAQEPGEDEADAPDGDPGKRDGHAPALPPEPTE
jgi:hypothetical protein